MQAAEPAVPMRGKFECNFFRRRQSLLLSGGMLPLRSVKQKVVFAKSPPTHCISPVDAANQNGERDSKPAKGTVSARVPYKGMDR